MKTLSILYCAALSTLVAAAPAMADAVIDLNLTRQMAKTQGSEPLRLLVHDGKALLGASSAAAGKDLLFDREKNLFQLIDHRRRTVMAMDEPAVIQATDQAEQMLTMARGFSEQLSLLPPKQRAKLEQMIGDSPLAQLAKHGDKAPGRQTLRAASSKTVGGVPCRSLELVGNNGKLGEMCLAEARALPLAEQDYATLEAMRQLAQHLAQRAAPLARTFGIPVPPLDDAKLSGLPIEMKNLSGDKRETVTLTRIASSPVPPQSLDIPSDYKSKPLTAWKF